MADTIQFEIVTPVSAVYRAEATEVLLPSTLGEIGILPGHRALLALIQRGSVEVREVGNTRRHFRVEPGYVEVDRDKVTLIVSECEGSNDIDIEAARRELAAVEAEVQSRKVLTETELEQQRERLERARSRIELVARATGRK